MKLKTLFKTSVAIILFACCMSAVHSAQRKVICSLDNGEMHPTHRAKILPNGTRVAEYKCLVGHTAWVIE